MSGGGRVGGQGGCERRIEVFLNIQKKTFFCRGAGVGSGGGSGLGVMVDVYTELKFFGKFTKKIGGGWSGGGSGWWGVQGGCERNVGGRG